MFTMNGTGNKFNSLLHTFFLYEVNGVRYVIVQKHRRH